MVGFRILRFSVFDRFLEGNFDSYVAHIRKPHVWGGEPEILMATHVLGFVSNFFALSLSL